MCDECLKEMRRAFEVQEKLFDAEESYFKVKRQEESELDAIEEEDKTTETRGKSLDQQSDFSSPSIITISDDESLAKFEPFKDVFDSSRIELLKDQEAREVLLPSKAIIAVEFMHKQNDMQNPVLNDSKKLGVTRFNITEEEVTKKKFPECMTCGKAFLSNRSLKAHVASHSPPSFQLTANNEDIEQKLLANSTNHSECATCKKTFANKSNLKRHIDLAHVKTRPFSCEICQQKFYHKTHLQIHMNIHSKNSRNNQMVEFDFKDCSKISRTKTELKHRQVVHSSKLLKLRLKLNRDDLELSPFRFATFRLLLR